MMREPAFLHLPRPQRVPLAGRRTLVLGLGDSGLSVARWAEAEGAHVRVADTRFQPPRLADFAGEFHGGPFAEALLEGVEILVVSPGLALEQPLIASALARGIPVLGDIELFAWHVRGNVGARVVAVTGTNGKTTVTSLTGHLLRAAGVDCEVAGNIGPAALEALKRRKDAGSDPAAWVLELSSYQLETTWSLAPDAASVLNLTEDHLDRYADMAQYGAAKARIFQGDGVQVLNRQDGASLAMAQEGRARMTFGLDAPALAWDFGIREGWLVQGKERILARAELPLRGDHNVANALAACALARALGARLEPLAEGLRSYRGLPHRVQLIASRAGVEWYDDSKGTNVGATVAALSGLGKRVILIAGGDGKGQDFSPLAGPVSRYAKAVLLIGRDAHRIEAALKGAGAQLERSGTLEEAVALAARLAAPGDAVLLSPACASFDMFRNYAHRGDAFASAVRSLGA